METEIDKYSRINSVLAISLMVMLCLVTIFFDWFNVIDVTSKKISVIITIALILFMPFVLLLVTPSTKKATEFLIKMRVFICKFVLNRGFLHINMINWNGKWINKWNRGIFNERTN